MHAALERPSKFLYLPLGGESRPPPEPAGIADPAFPAHATPLRQLPRLCLCTSRSMAAPIFYLSPGTGRGQGEGVFRRQGRVKGTAYRRLGGDLRPGLPRPWHAASAATPARSLRIPPDGRPAYGSQTVMRGLVPRIHVFPFRVLPFPTPPGRPAAARRARSPPISTSPLWRGRGQGEGVFGRARIPGWCRNIASRMAVPAVAARGFSVRRMSPIRVAGTRGR